MEVLRHWSTRHAAGLKRVYDACSRYAPYLGRALRVIGPDRAERMLAPLEHASKALFFDCKMCGNCVLSSTGMSCPMNCPKTIRNGPCGGVRENGHCEVRPEMRCVWVAAWDGASRMKGGSAIKAVQFAVDNQVKGQSSWLRMARDA